MFQHWLQILLHKEKSPEMQLTDANRSKTPFKSKLNAKQRVIMLSLVCTWFLYKEKEEKISIQFYGNVILYTTNKMLLIFFSVIFLFSITHKKTRKYNGLRLLYRRGHDTSLMHEESDSKS